MGEGGGRIRALAMLWVMSGRTGGWGGAEGRWIVQDGSGGKEGAAMAVAVMGPRGR